MAGAQPRSWQSHELKRGALSSAALSTSMVFREAVVGGENQARSITMAMPWPTPMHMETSAYLPPVR
jgi:hypothetical protein